MLQKFKNAFFKALQIKAMMQLELVGPNLSQIENHIQNWIDCFITKKDTLVA